MCYRWLAGPTDCVAGVVGSLFALACGAGRVGKVVVCVIGAGKGGAGLSWRAGEVSGIIQEEGGGGARGQKEPQ
jgi:hypothetical protein